MPQDESVTARVSNGDVSKGSENPADTPDISSSHAQPNETADEDVNPRSPKRRRLTPPNDEDTFDIGAAAARALALSLGQSVANINVGTTTQQVPQMGSQQHALTESASKPPQKTVRQVRLDKLPSLHDLASQILHFLARLNHLDIGEMLFGPPSERGQEYSTLKQKFEEQKRIYLAGSSPFLAAHVLEFHEPDQVDMIRRINLAIFMASIFSGEIGLRIMDMNFIDVFVPEGGRLLKAQGSIYLELKTHAFMAATRTASTMLNQVMMDLFPSDMEKALLQKRPNAKGLAPSEQDFLNRLGSRRDILYSVIRSNKLGTLPDTYRWNDFAREVSVYLTKSMEGGVPGSKDNLDAPFGVVDEPLAHHEQTERQKLLHSLTSLEANGAVSQAFPRAPESSNGPGMMFDIQAMVAQAARAAALSMGDGIDMTLLPPAADLPTNASLTTLTNNSNSAGTIIARPTPNAVSAATTEASTSVQVRPVPDETEGRISDGSVLTLQQDNNEVPHSSQTAPTQVLYERARQVNTNKAMSSKKPAPPTHRRPWTTEEENALMTGLDQVKGPHWSQILAMYGPGGTINESLKDRNQVQLKDKARNLKLFFLKASIEVPYYLQAVTGDLKTRAPGQAEKMERERIQGDAEKPSENDALNSTDLTEIQDDENAEDIDMKTPGYEEAGLSDQTQSKAVTGEVKLEFDMEAMIAQAAASASKGLGPPS